MKRIKTALLPSLTFLLGILVGGYLFVDTRPRSILALNKCGGTCLQPNELVGLLASVGVQNFSGVLPSVVKETDKTVVISHPAAHARIHLVIIPKKDIKNIGEFSEDDREYLVDAFRLIREIVAEKELVDYNVSTNGPGYQAVTYLHFHLIAR